MISLAAIECGACQAQQFFRCPNCRFDNIAGAKFCNECGVRLDPEKIETEKGSRNSASGERRQLTVMFCDLVGSTAIAESMDVEDLRAIMDAFQDTGIEAIRQYGGTVAKRLGDGLVVFFGFPQAHEDDAQRAIYAALGVVSEIARLSDRIESECGVKIAVRIGIHTGVVVAGASGFHAEGQIEVFGETPTIAARLQEIAEPGAILVSSSTHRLVSENFDFIPLGPHAIKGLRKQVGVYQVLSPRARAHTLISRQLRPEIVGRTRELEFLRAKWSAVEAGDNQGVFIKGEPGIGKSRLVDAFKSFVTNRPGARVREIFCSPYHQGTPFYAVVARLQHDLIGLRSDDDPEIAWAKLTRFASEYGIDSPESLSLLASLVSISDGHESASAHLSAEGRRLRTLELLARIYTGGPMEGHSLIVVENAQWADPSTIEFIGVLMSREDGDGVMTLVTARPAFLPPWQDPLHPSTVELTRLDNSDVEKIVLQITGGRKLPPEILSQVLTKTDGVPLFVEELTKMVLESDFLLENGKVYELAGPIPELAIPATLQDSLMARLDRLSTVKEIAQLASVIGRGFSFRLLQTVSDLDGAILRRELQRLVEAELIEEFRIEKGELAFRFRHALIQDAAYESLLKARRQHYHHKIAQAIVSQFPETADTQPEILAAHYVAAGLIEPAIAYWIQAGQRALVRSANHEAIANYQKALRLLLKTKESTERLARELTIQASMGLALIATRGFGASDVGLCFSRAENLCETLGDSPQFFPVLWGLWVFYLVRGELQIAQDRAEHLLFLGDTTGDLGMRIEGHFTLGDTLFWRGDFTESRRHLERLSDLYSFEEHASHAVLFGQDPGVSGLSYLSFALWALGYPDRAIERSRQARELAKRRAHPFSTAWALGCSALLSQFRGDHAETLRFARETVAHSIDQGQPFWISAGTFLQGWAKFKIGERVEGLAEMHYGLAYYQSIGSQVVQPHFIGLLAETLGEVGEVGEGLDLVIQALEKSRTHGERASEIDLHRIHAGLLMASSERNIPEAITALEVGVRLATHLGARSYKLRSLAELLRLTHSPLAAEELEAVVNTFDEGLIEPSFIRARATLDVLRRKP